MSGHHREQPGEGTSIYKVLVMGGNMVCLRNRSTESERRKVGDESRAGFIQDSGSNEEPWKTGW